MLDAVQSVHGKANFIFFFANSLLNSFISASIRSLIEKNIHAVSDEIEAYFRSRIFVSYPMDTMDNNFCMFRQVAQRIQSQKIYDYFFYSSLVRPSRRRMRFCLTFGEYDNKIMSGEIKTNVKDSAFYGLYKRLLIFYGDFFKQGSIQKLCHMVFDY